MPRLTQRDERDLDFELEDLVVRSSTSSQKTVQSDLESGSHDRISPRPSLVSRIKRFGRLALDGPDTPEDEFPQFKNDLLQQFERFPGRIANDFPLRLRLPFALAYFVFWILSVRYVLSPALTELPTYANESGERVEVVSLSCRDERSMWLGKNAECGMDASKCQPFENRTVVFRCPALCDTDSWTYSSLPVGNETYKYRGFYIGGGPVSSSSDSNDLSLPYRADSFPCGAAIHAGVISPLWGGCAKVEYTGFQPGFPATKGHYGVYDSIDFDAFFPASFKFVKNTGCTNCYDMRFAVAIINFLLGIPVVYFGSGALAYWTMVTVGFWTVLLAIDPPIIVNVGDPESLPSLVSLGFQRFLPFCFMAYTIWHLAIRRTFQMPSSPVLKTVLWYPLFWTGILNNLTFDRLPVDRLTVADITTQPGALVTFFGIVSLIGTCAVIQAYKLWLSGRFKIYLVVYSTFVVGLWILGSLHGLNLRIHHYVLALLLIPGTSTRGTTAFLFQGVLVGLFVNGISRWGLASVVETARALRRSDPTGAIKPPTITDYSAGILSWVPVELDNPRIVDGEIVAPHDRLSGYALLVNDVERYNGGNTSVDLNQLMADDPELGQELTAALEFGNGSTQLYLRVARAASDRTGDFSAAARLTWPLGELTVAPAGASIT
ncbi:unnamed protein product [Kuraishia capsulata CBS 1993]|uniref:LCCL domain-containing protein n=1 Tax=Kuraishia capsulata CBS 1993 TaxID=1382522 RepID=W6MS88_9ASCO|nr:uncharacterized protein KUCA_T00005251001 [Kuraishia capsulata CBS 1993]CDK29263.1 unnamed protein product [Kuraishia capsulata CBS 1993]